MHVMPGRIGTVFLIPTDETRCDPKGPTRFDKENRQIATRASSFSERHRRRLRPALFANDPRAGCVDRVIQGREKMERAPADCLCDFTREVQNGVIAFQPRAVAGEAARQIARIRKWKRLSRREAASSLARPQDMRTASFATSH